MTEERVCKFKRATEIIQPEEQREKRLGKKMKSLMDPKDNIERSNTHGTGLPEAEEKET